ncbi:DUF2244 domain-containing protein [Nitrosococcus oceani]|uniref:DUF2244 domain-containing protein n=2 Tax=Nitrosococcus oceani TaxID=1229 RepID=Q3J6Q7_NITOC|nr:DUF2244 domain-containing protein [Nitrosococcus oceani]ABA59489.1 conserved hypothetical protein [Nitrosococcus oceani ATCC 19707]KFI18055.1 hypothetical protein IB75_16185 [Nitrosococcus oceani C-27]KFI21294.1 hypothetical protein HW44_15860 [Nitrosococcus oceani]
MVCKRYGPSEDTLRFILRPNSSLSWRGMKAVFFAMTLVLVIIAGGFSLLGLWLIFPFAGLELLILGIAFYLSARRAQHCEIITIGQEEIEIFRGRETTGETWKFHRYWARVRIELPPYAWHMSRLIIGSHGHEVEIGVFLSEEERLRLAKELQAVCGA